MFKYTTQVSRIAALKALQDSLSTCVPDVIIDKLKVYSSQVDEIHKAFLKDHAYFEVTWPAAHLSHEYFTTNMHLKESQLCFNFKLSLSRLKQELEPVEPPHSQSSSATPGNLPELSLPTFKGDYLAWPAYSELFTALISSSKQLTDIEKLQYLRSSLKGEPAQKVEALPLKGASFKLAWNLLSERYQNKRILIQSQLDKLFSAQSVLTKSAAALAQLISTVEEAHTSLISLGVTDNLSDCILVHQVARNLDKFTREAWETTLGPSQDYPTFHQVREFVTGKALEWVEAPPFRGASTKSSSTPGPCKSKWQKASSHHSAQAHPDRKVYQCDCCGDDHFIVMCPKLRGLNVPQRRKLVANKMLCYNCCGRHASIK